MVWWYVGCVAFAAFLAAIFFWRSEIELFINTEGFKPTALQYALAIGISLIILTSLILFALTMESVKRDHAAYELQNKKEASPPETISESDYVSPMQAMIGCYAARGYYRVEFIEDNEAEQSIELWTTDEDIEDELNWYRRPGVLIYEDGTATQFSVAVLHDGDSWAFGDAQKVNRQMTGRLVKIRTAINRPLLKELIAVNDYVLGLGLASHRTESDPAENENLAHARGYNIGYAIYDLGLKAPDRIFGFSIGYATAPPAKPELEPRQRSVVVLGVNASRDVVVGDVLKGAASIVKLDGVALDQYSIPIDNPVQSPRVDVVGRYRTLSDIRVSKDNSTMSWVLPAVEQEPPC